jgi:uncharacterized protein YndB with AHSA1/START domain
MHVEDRVVINRPIDAVWEFFTDFFNTPRIPSSRTLGSRVTSSGPLGEGSTFQTRVRALGFENRLSGQVVEWDPPHSLAMTMAGRPIRSFRTRITLAEVPGGTELVRVQEIEPRRLLMPLMPVYAPIYRRQSRAVIQNLKRMLESETG